MLVYGNKNTRLSCIIRDYNKMRAAIEFPSVNRQIYVPRYMIHSPIEEKNKEQELEIETWYLKKNRIIPLI